MPRRKSWHPSTPERIRLKRGFPEAWSYYFPGFRSKGSAQHVPECTWIVERMGKTYLVTNSLTPQQGDAIWETLAQVRAYIASHYEYLP